MSDDTLLGVVEPWRDDEEALEAQVLESQRDLRDTLFTSAFDEAQARNIEALAHTQLHLTELRHLIKETYAEIKVLVEEERLLRSMVAVGKRSKRQQ